MQSDLSGGPPSPPQDPTLCVAMPPSRSRPYPWHTMSHLHTDRARGSSHLGSAGSSSSETLASAGPSPEDSRAIRTRGVLEFMDELDSKDTCLGQQGQVGAAQWGLGAGGCRQGTVRWRAGGGLGTGPGRWDLTSKTGLHVVALTGGVGPPRAHARPRQGP